jgi:hypothetical protein
MMKVSGTKISLTRGDSAIISVACTNGTTPFALTTGDTIYFTIKASATTTTKLVQKIITTFTQDGKATVTLNPADTKPLAYGEYLYDVQLTLVTGEVITIIAPSRFTILEEVTYE